MRMVQVADKMSIGMCLATLEELRYIVGREAEYRKQLTTRGLRESEFCKFEDIADDARSCIVCKTTLYISALVCKHMTKIVCMNHVEAICEECAIGDCCLRLLSYICNILIELKQIKYEKIKGFCFRYRYKLEELIPLVQKLAQRTTSFEEWKKKAELLFAEESQEKLGGIFKTVCFFFI